MTIPFSGGCACGGIHYECTSNPVMMLQCHCRDCQRSSGGALVAAVIVPIESLKVTLGSLRYYASPSTAGGSVHRGFCAECGCPVLTKFDSAPQLIGIRVASLEDPSWFKPQLDMWTCDAQPWDHMNPALSKFEKYPPFGQ